MNLNIVLKYYKILRISKNLILSISFENYKIRIGIGY